MIDETFLTTKSWVPRGQSTGPWLIKAGKFPRPRRPPVARKRDIDVARQPASRGGSRPARRRRPRPATSATARVSRRRRRGEHS
jgi:hypothetical protein